MGSSLSRVPEPETMSREEETEYIRCNSVLFRDRHPLVDSFDMLCPGFPGRQDARALDLGCGVANMSIEFAKAYPELDVVAVDASENMLRHASVLVEWANCGDRVSVRCGRLPEDSFGEPDGSFDLVFARSTLHHFADPARFWGTVRRYAKPDAAVFVVDLLRPPDLAGFEALVWQRFGGRLGPMRSAFRASLLAAHTEDEISGQLADAGLGGFEVQSDGVHVEVCRPGRFGRSRG